MLSFVAVAIGDSHPSRGCQCEHVSKTYSSCEFDGNIGDVWFRLCYQSGHTAGDNDDEDEDDCDGDRQDHTAYEYLYWSLCQCHRSLL